MSKKATARRAKAAGEAVARRTMAELGLDDAKLFDLARADFSRQHDLRGLRLRGGFDGALFVLRDKVSAHVQLEQARYRLTADGLQLVHPLAELAETAQIAVEEDDCEDEDDLDEGEGVYAGRPPSLAPTPEELAALDRHADVERRAFGRECGIVMNLLKLHKLPATFEDAKQWMRQVGESALSDRRDPAPREDWSAASHAIATWLEAGWTEVKVAEIALTMVGDPNEAGRLLALDGMTAAGVCASGGRGVDWLARLDARLREAAATATGAPCPPRS
jgi:hypothetical protein